mmetsp:Transcript_28632/g.77535  ORF Transcript_28632/g.77535 Transcript_28632/m.77535 type:complete len:91 (-) Transcript_28632:3449-3721(-)
MHRGTSSVDRYIWHWTVVDVASSDRSIIRRLRFSDGICYTTEIIERTDSARATGTNTTGSHGAISSSMMENSASYSEKKFKTAFSKLPFS